MSECFPLGMGKRQGWPLLSFFSVLFFKLPSIIIGKKSCKTCGGWVREHDFFHIENIKESTKITKINK